MLVLSSDVPQTKITEKGRVSNKDFTKNNIKDNVMKGLQLEQITGAYWYLCTIPT